MKCLLFGGLLLLLSSSSAKAGNVATFTWDCDKGKSWDTLLNQTRVYTNSGGENVNTNVEVLLQGECSQPLTLDPNLDSGNDNFTVTWTTAPGQTKRARFNGGVPLQGSKFTPAKDPRLPASSSRKVLQYDLTEVVSALGPAGWGNYAAGGLGNCVGDQAELFFSKAPMQTARFPNNPIYGGPWMNWLNIDQANVNSEESRLQGSELPPLCDIATGLRSMEAARAPICRAEEDDAITNMFTFNASGVSTATLANTPSDLNDVWIHGFWSFGWADSYVQLLNINCSSASGDICTATYNASTPPVYGMKDTARFYILNTISELDSPGEYFIDKTSNMLYFYPPVSPGTNLTDADEIYISVQSGPLVSNSESATPLSHVHFTNLDFGYGRDIGIGFSNVANVQLRNLNTSNFLHQAVGVNGENVVIQDLSGRGMGCGVISVSGGNPMTLQTSNITVDRVNLSYYGRLKRTYQPGVGFGGVGITVQNSYLAYGPHQGMTGGGNNHKFLNNKFHFLCYGATDSGAWYVGRSWTDRGMLLDGNYFSEVNMVEPTKLGSPDVNAMYFDDEQSGVTATNNVCNNVQSCFLVGGGRNNRVEGNRCIDVHNACILFDNRGMNWQKGFCTPPNGLLPQGLIHVNYTFPPYSVEYPAIVDTLQDRPCVPVSNSFIGNSFCKTSKFLDQPESVIESWGSFTADNNADNDC